MFEVTFETCKPQFALYSALYKIVAKLKLGPVPPIPSTKSLSPIYLRDLIAERIKSSKAIFNDYQYLYPCSDPDVCKHSDDALDLYCEDIQLGRRFGSRLEIAAFCDLFACEITLHYSGSHFAYLFPSKFDTARYRATLYGRTIDSVEIFHHVTSEDRVDDVYFYSKGRVLDSTTAVMAGQLCTLQNHLSRYHQRAGPVLDPFPPITSSDSSADDISLQNAPGGTAEAADLEDGSVHEVPSQNVALQARIDNCTSALQYSSDNMKKFIRTENKLCSVAHQLKRVQNCSVEECKGHLQLCIIRLQQQIQHKYKARMSALDKVMCNVRMLGILLGSSHARDLFADMQSVASKLPLQTNFAGEGVGDKHRFWTYMCTLFNSDYDTTFPHDHLPRRCTVAPTAGKAPKVLEAPLQYQNGLLAGLNLLSAVKPPSFPDDYFTAEKLLDLWKEGTKLYREMLIDWEASGNHGSRPMYHFVHPGTKCEYYDVDCSHCFSKMKRWDSIAILIFVEKHPEFLSMFKSVIKGGAGGIISEAPAEQSITPASSKKVNTYPIPPPLPPLISDLPPGFKIQSRRRNGHGNFSFYFECEV